MPETPPRAPLLESPFITREDLRTFTYSDWIGKEKKPAKKTNKWEKREDEKTINQFIETIIKKYEPLPLIVNQYKTGTEIEFNTRLPLVYRNKKGEYEEITEICEDGYTKKEGSIQEYKDDIEKVTKSIVNETLIQAHDYQETHYHEIEEEVHSPRGNRIQMKKVYFPHLYARIIGKVFTLDSIIQSKAPELLKKEDHSFKEIQNKQILGKNRKIIQSNEWIELKKKVLINTQERARPTDPLERLRRELADVGVSTIYGTEVSGWRRYGLGSIRSTRQQ